MRTMNKGLALCMVMVMIFVVIVGCSSNNNNGNTASSSGVASESPKKSGEQVTLKYLDWARTKRENRSKKASTPLWQRILT